MKEFLQEYINGDLKWRYFLENKLKQDYKKTVTILDKLDDLFEIHDFPENEEGDADMENIIALEQFMGLTI